MPNEKPISGSVNYRVIKSPTRISRENPTMQMRVGIETEGTTGMTLKRMRRAVHKELCSRLGIRDLRVDFVTYRGTEEKTPMRGSPHILEQEPPETIASEERRLTEKAFQEGLTPVDIEEIIL